MAKFRDIVVEIVRLPGLLHPDNPHGQHTNGPRTSWVRVDGGEWIDIGREGGVDERELIAALDMVDDAIKAAIVRRDERNARVMERWQESLDRMKDA